MEQVNGRTNERGGRNIEQPKETLFTKLWKADSPWSFTCCIFRIPNVLRRQNPYAYEPEIVSIGPFHRGAEKFQLVENVKQWYLWKVLSRMKSTITLDNLIEKMKVMEDEARGYYSDPCNYLDQNDFIEMLILDGCFLIEFFRKIGDEYKRDDKDPIFNSTLIFKNLYRDLLLLENQLPWFVIEFFHDIIGRNDPHHDPLSVVVINLFKEGSMADPSNFSYKKPDSSIVTLHILDLIRTSLVQEHVHRDEDERSRVDLLLSPTVYHSTNKLPAATLSKAGVKFRSTTLEEQQGKGCILNITFKNGVFKIPTLTINERTESLFRNLMAYEQCYDSCMGKITSYVVLMDSLINGAKDVDLLCEKGILANRLSSDAGSRVFNDLHDGTDVFNFVYGRLCSEVCEYYNNPWNKYKEKARQGLSDYFDTPWSCMALATGFLLLVLTFLQTVFTIHPR